MQAYALMLMYSIIFYYVQVTLQEKDENVRWCFLKIKGLHLQITKIYVHKEKRTFEYRKPITLEFNADKPYCLVHQCMYL